MPQFRDQDSIDSTVHQDSNSAADNNKFTGTESTDYASVGTGGETLGKDFQQRLDMCVAPAPAHGGVSSSAQLAYGGSGVLLVPVAVPLQSIWPMQQPSTSPVVVDEDTTSTHADRRARSRSTMRSKGHQGTPKRPLPGSVEEWEDREEKREDGLRRMKESDAYKSNNDLRSRLRPQTPDPHDHCLSKRDWEKALGACRAFHRNMYTLVHEMGYDKIRAARVCKRVSSNDKLSPEEVLQRVVEQLHG